MTEKKYIFAFAGGGSGGHSYPLLSIASQLKKNFPRANIYFVTTSKSVESKILSNSEWPFFSIPSGKMNAQSFLTILTTLCKLPLAMLKSLWILLRSRPDFVMSAGGYAGAPFLVVAALIGIPCIVYEQNRKPGLANKWMAKFSSLVFVNFPETREFFVGKKTVVVGLPFRMEILSARWTEKDWAINLNKKPFHIFVFGGSQGAQAINTMIVESLDFLGPIASDIFIHHQTGQNDFPRIQEEYKQKKFSSCLIEPYVYDMSAAYKTAHLVISRAGASTLVELAAAAKAAILIPLVSKDNHQVPNAQNLAKKNAAIVISQNDCSGKDLAAMIQNFYKNREKIRSLSNNIAVTMIENAEEKIIQELGELF